LFTVCNSDYVSGISKADSVSAKMKGGIGTTYSIETVEES
jgi:hypothetical protein